MGKLESKFQAELVKELKTRFPNCIVLKNDAGYRPSIPDLIILWNEHWATLECKRSFEEAEEAAGTNQGYYVNRMDAMSFSAFIYPENKEDVLYDLQQAFRA